MALNVGGSWKSYKLKGKTITQTVKPDDDYLDIQITDMESYANVKLKEIKVENCSGSGNNNCNTAGGF